MGLWLRHVIGGALNLSETSWSIVEGAERASRSFEG